MIYLDTSVLVALLVNEPRSDAVVRWYGRSTAELVAAVWCVPEFASALGIKQRTGQLDARQATDAWERFGRLVAGDVRLLPVEPAHFHRAAQLAIDAATSLRAGDALHLACAEQMGAKSMATLDDVMGSSAQRMKMKRVLFS